MWRRSEDESRCQQGEASEDDDELITADMDLDLIEEVRRVWQFYRDRRPETYQAMVDLLP